MSFILDALKKSDSDRQRKNRPDSAHVPTGTGASSSSRWLLLVGLLLLANVLVLAFFALKSPPATEETLSISDPANATESPKTFQDIVADAKRSQPDDAVSTAKPSADPVVVDATPSEPAAGIDAVSLGSTSSTSYRTFNDVRLDGSVQLPDLHLDIHVFSGTPTERFVFVNMSKYKEKATLSEGPLVAEIVPEGVVLEYLGTRFLLPRE